VKDKERAGRPKLVEDTELEALLDEDPYPIDDTQLIRTEVLFI